eukprot:Gb_39538 [translate_table: standard]
MFCKSFNCHFNLKDLPARERHNTIPWLNILEIP